MSVPPSAPADILLRITKRRRERLAAAMAPAGQNPFLAALAARKAAGKPAIIAEVKMGSPRLGNLAGRVDPRRQAATYAANGATCLSVVVEPDFFHGSYELLTVCREASGLPAIAKDFIVDPLQLLWAKEAGAAAILLIAALYTPEDLQRYAGLARGLGLVPLIETHDAADVLKLTAKLAAGLASAPWELVGVNNRNLRTFEVDLGHSIALLPTLPASAIKVAESGIDGRPALDRLHAAGFDAFLIGESLLLAADPAAELRELSQ